MLSYPCKAQISHGSTSLWPKLSTCSCGGSNSALLGDFRTSVPYRWFPRPLLCMGTFKGTNLHLIPVHFALALPQILLY